LLPPLLLVLTIRMMAAVVVVVVVVHRIYLFRCFTNADANAEKNDDNTIVRLKMDLGSFARNPSPRHS